MAKKVRELKAMLLKSGFTELSGKDSNDAKPYQEKEVMDAIKWVKD